MAERRSRREHLLYWKIPMKWTSPLFRCRRADIVMREDPAFGSDRHDGDPGPARKRRVSGWKSASPTLVLVSQQLTSASSHRILQSTDASECDAINSHDCTGATSRKDSRHQKDLPVPSCGEGMAPRR